jgi:hypothetical protein
MACSYSSTYSRRLELDGLLLLLYLFYEVRVW